jgi:hypothetical protein
VDALSFVKVKRKGRKQEHYLNWGKYDEEDAGRRVSE